ncbi:hypothetical protein GW17_00024429 [Ensete ventricosum]|nr:hypothetical protein GW17_00024429 [Ensete ventricosum]
MWAAAPAAGAAAFGRAAPPCAGAALAGGRSFQRPHLQGVALAAGVAPAGASHARGPPRLLAAAPARGFWPWVADPA